MHDDPFLFFPSCLKPRVLFTLSGGSIKELGLSMKKMMMVMMMILLIKLCGGSTTKEVESTKKPLGKTFMGTDNIFLQTQVWKVCRTFPKNIAEFFIIYLSDHLAVFFSSQLSYHISHRNDI